MEEIVLNQIESFQNICRTCLTANSNFISIFSCDGRFKKTYAEMIMEFAPVMITLNQHLTSNVCTVCADSICTLYHFQQQCIQADKIIRSGFEALNSTPSLFIKHETPDMYNNDASSKDCDISNKLIKQEPDDIEIVESKVSAPLNSDEKIISPEVKVEKQLRGIFSNKKCNDTITRDNIIKAAITKHQGGLNQCITCNKTYSLRKSFRRHITTKHIDEPEKSKLFSKVKNVIKRKLVDNDAVPKQDLIKAAIIEHSQGKPNQCITCNKFYSAQEYLRRHVIMTHVDGSKKSQLCNSCGKIITNNFSRHKSICNGIKFDCVVCGKRFTRKENLRGHSLTHKKDKKPIICELCGQQFLFKASFYSHKRYSHGDAESNQTVEEADKKLMCELCNKMYATPTAVRIHKNRVHSNHPEVTCEYCNKLCQNKYTLKSHQAFAHCDRSKYYDQIKKQYTCNICGLKLKYLSYKTHMRLHTGEKPYKCNYCTKTFRQHAHVKSHERLHTGEKPFKCEHCSKAFRHQNTCIEHTRTHTGEKPHKCKFCDRRFNHITNMKKHVITSHKICFK